MTACRGATRVVTGRIRRAWRRGYANLLVIGSRRNLPGVFAYASKRAGRSPETGVVAGCWRILSCSKIVCWRHLKQSSRRHVPCGAAMPAAPVRPRIVVAIAESRFALRDEWAHRIERLANLFITHCARRVRPSRACPTPRDTTCRVRDASPVNRSMLSLADAGRWKARSRLACIDGAARCMQDAVSEPRLSACVAMKMLRPLRRRITVQAARERANRTSMRASSAHRAASSMHGCTKARSLHARR